MATALQICKDSGDYVSSSGISSPPQEMANGIVREEDHLLFLSGERTHTHSFWQCFAVTLHKLDTHQWPVGKVTEQKACACIRECVLNSSKLAEHIVKSKFDASMCVCLCALVCAFMLLCVLKGVPIYFGSQTAASSVLMAAPRGWHLLLTVGSKRGRQS